MVKKNNNNLLPLITMLITLVIIAVFMNQPSDISEMKMSEAIGLFKENKVEYFDLNLGNGNLEIDVKGEEENIIYRVPSVNYFVEKIDPYVEQNNVPHDFIPAAWELLKKGYAET